MLRSILNSKWTLLKSCCFFPISLRSIINLAHNFKSPFLDIEITNSWSVSNFIVYELFKFVRGIVSNSLQTLLNKPLIVFAHSKSKHEHFLLMCSKRSLDENQVCVVNYTNNISHYALGQNKKAYVLNFKYVTVVHH